MLRLAQRVLQNIMSNSKPKITIVTNGDDWEGLYLDGVLFVQDHNITIDSLIEALGLEKETVEVSSRWLGDEVVSLPEKLNKIPKKAIIS